MERAGYWLGRDIQAAQTVAMGPGAGLPLSANWTDEAQDSFRVTFIISGTQLVRSLVENGQAPRTMTLMQYVNPSPVFTSCNLTNGLLTFRVTSTVKNWSLSRSFRVKKRPW